MKKLIHPLLVLFLLALPGFAAKPNVLWIYLEDVSGWFSCYGETLIETPHIDALAADGIRFDRFYTPAGVCSATRSAQILGAMQTTYGVHNHRSSRNNAKGTKHDGIGMITLPEDVKTLPEIFRGHGYFTFNQSGKDDYNFIWSAEKMYSPNSKSNRWRNREKGQPFFGQIQLRGGKLGKRAKKTMDRSKVPVPPYYPDIPTVREEIAHHYDCLLTTDQQVGEIIDELKADGLYDSTYIFLHSDHGYKLHRHKQYLYEGGIHMPLIVTGPGIKKGQERSDLISGIDLAPTGLAVCGFDIPKSMEGGNFLAKNYQHREYVVASRNRCDFTIENIRAIVTPRYKYLRNYTDDRPFMQPSYKDPWPVSKALRKLMAEGKMNEHQLVFFGPTKEPEELYDLENDPHEIHNLAKDPKHRKALEEHRAILAKWIEETGDQAQGVENDDSLLQCYYRWRDRCVNPEFDRIKHLVEPRKSKEKKK